MSGKLTPISEVQVEDATEDKLLYDVQRFKT